MNLLGNSLKYTQTGQINVSLKRQKLSTKSLVFEVILVVSDTGQGISTEYLSRSLYAPWQQENKNAAGSGLGLSVVSRIVADLNGEIDVQSTKGVGTQVTVHFPAKLASPSSHSQLPPKLRLGLIGHFFMNEAVCKMAEPPKHSEVVESPELQALLRNVTTLAADWFKTKIEAVKEPNAKDADFIWLDQIAFGDLGEEEILKRINRLYSIAISEQEKSPTVLLTGQTSFLRSLHSHLKASATNMSFLPRPSVLPQNSLI